MNPHAAFSRSGNEWADDLGHAGMELRDYFAARAMQSLILTQGGSAGGKDYDYDAIALESYTFADAMVYAREQA